MNALILALSIGLVPSDYYGGVSSSLVSTDYYGGLAPAAPVAPVAPRRTSGYPTRGNNWNIEGDWNASRERIIAHLLTHQNHRGHFSRAWLETLSRQQLLSLHSDDHEHRVKTQYVAQAALTKNEKKIVKDFGRVVYGTKDGRHPGPLGSAIRGFFGDPRYQQRASACPNGRCPR